MSIQPINKNIIFVFKDKVNTAGEFVRPPTASGIELVGGHEDSAKQSRWGVVVAAGPEAKGILPGEEILIPALRWTNNIKVGDQRFWKTDFNEIVAVRHSTTADLQILGDFIAFQALPRKAIKSSLIIVPTADLDSPAEGTILRTGPDVTPELTPGNTIYYNDANFESFFIHDGKRLAFIREAEVFAYSVDE